MHDTRIDSWWLSLSCHNYESARGGGGLMCCTNIKLLSLHLPTPLRPPPHLSLPTAMRFKIKSCQYVAVSLADSKQCSVSKVTTHLHCSHGHHIYHLLHGTHWLANQRGIAHGDVRRVQWRSLWEHDTDAAVAALLLAGTRGNRGIQS